MATTQRGINDQFRTSIVVANDTEETVYVQAIPVPRFFYPYINISEEIANKSSSGGYYGNDFKLNLQIQVRRSNDPSVVAGVDRIDGIVLRFEHLENQIARARPLSSVGPGIFGYYTTARRLYVTRYGPQRIPIVNFFVRVSGPDLRGHPFLRDFRQRTREPDSTSPLLQEFYCLGGNVYQPHGSSATPTSSGSTWTTTGITH